MNGTKTSRLVAAGAGAVGLGVGPMLDPLPAHAGHTNTLLSADLNGRNEVAADGSGAGRGAEDPAHPEGRTPRLLAATNRTGRRG